MTSSVSLENLVSDNEIDQDLGLDQPLQDETQFPHVYSNGNEETDEVITPATNVHISLEQDSNDDDAHTYDADQESQIERLQTYRHANMPLYTTEQEFQNQYKENEFEYVPYGQRIKTKMKKCRCGPQCCKGCMVSTVPILGWLPRYVIRTQLLADIVSGITVCVMNIPQGMAYGMLASLPAVYGLYLGFFAPIVYALTGTSRELAMGTYSVISIMVSSAIEGVVPQYPVDQPPPTGFFNNTNTTATSMPEWDRQQELIDAAIILALLVGIIQLAMGILRLGWVTIYLSDPFIRGYTTGSGVHVFTSQVDEILGVNVASYDGAFKLYYVYRDLFAAADDWNHVTILLAMSCVVVLILIKEVETRYKKQLHGFPLGAELVVVILATLSSYLLNLEENHGVEIVGEIPAGIPAPSIPSTTYLTDLIGAAFPIAIVAYAIAVAMASLFAQKKNYKIDSNQELVAAGTTNFVCSFFSCYPASGAMARSLVQDSSGATSQIAGLVNSALMLVVLLWIGPLFETLPTCVLSAIIMVALRGIFRQLLDLPRLYKYDVTDFHVWWVSCVAVILFDVDIGLLLGVGFAIFVHVWRTQEPYCTLLGRIPGTDIYKDIKWYSVVTEIPGIKIFRMHSSLYFANTAHFKSKVYKLTGVNPRKILQIKARQQQLQDLEMRREEKKKNKEMKKRVKENGNVIEDERTADGTPKVNLSPENSIHTIILDCSSFNFIDSTGLNGLRQLFREYDQVGIKILLAHCIKRVRDFFSRCDFYETVGCEANRCLFVTVHGAVMSAIEDDTDENNITSAKVRTVISNKNVTSTFMAKQSPAPGANNHTDDHTDANSIESTKL
ncbi:prestin-like [Saccoglossus kowalevskii]